MKKRKGIQKSSELDEINKLCGKQYLIDSYNMSGRCDVAGAASAMRISTEEVRERFEPILQALNTRKGQRNKRTAAGRSDP